MRTKFINTLYTLEETNPDQNKKDRIYKEIIVSLRSEKKIAPNEFDLIGFNLLHWAILANQPEEEIINLIENEDIDVNCGTQLISGVESFMFNVTPLHFAVQTANESLGRLLLDNGADENVKRKVYKGLYGPLSGNNYSYYDPIKETTPKYALRRGNAGFKLFENKVIEEYEENRANDHRKYKSIFPQFLASIFGYSRQEKLNAVAAFKDLINNEKNDGQELIADLRQLRQDHPAINQGELGNIYQASIKARR